MQLLPDGPRYDDFAVGDTIPPLPAVTVTEADNVAYRAITGDQHRLSADRDAYRRASGGSGALVNPGLVMQFSIGQTTNATRRVIANLYYRNVAMLRPVEVGATLRTEASVAGLRDASPKGDLQRGKVWLRIMTSDDHGPVLSYERCALVPARSPDPVGHTDDIPGPGDPVPLTDLTANLPDWDLPDESHRWPLGESRTDPLRDFVDGAAALVRMTFNQAAVHRDVTRTGGRRLVYGGHVQALAQASLTRMVPGLALVLAWDGCDHLAPAHEGDLVEFEHRLVEETAVERGRLWRFEVIGRRVADDRESVDILRWQPVVWVA